MVLFILVVVVDVVPVEEAESVSLFSFLILSL